MATEITPNPDPDSDSPDPEIDAAEMKMFFRGLEVATRSPDAALKEMRNATMAFDECLRELAHDFPGVVGVGAIVLGESLSLVFAQSSGFMHYSPVALNRVRLLAHIVSGLDEDLLAEFEAELNRRKEVASLRAKIQAIREGKEN